MIDKTYSTKLILWLPLSILVLVLLNISLGSIQIPFLEVINWLVSGEISKESWGNILLNFRLPKALAAMGVGIGLSIAGLQMQTLFRNPLAGPFVLGLSSGASLGVALLFLLGIGGTATLLSSSWLVVIAASIGSGLVLTLVMLVSLRVRDSMTLLIIGLMFASLTGAVVSILQYFSTGEEIQVYLFWTFGSLGGLSWQEVSIMLTIIFLGIILSIFSIKALNGLLLSENYIQSMGLSLKSVRILIITSTSLLAGSITAFCGPIAFIGLAVPHLTRLLFNTSDHKVLLPAVAMVGAIVLLVCDIISQIPGSEMILPINAITSIVGAPVVIWIIVRRRSMRNTFNA